jgi:hypothetical protein
MTFGQCHFVCRTDSLPTLAHGWHNVGATLGVWLPYEWINVVPMLVWCCANIKPTLAGCQSDGQNEVGPTSFTDVGLTGMLMLGRCQCVIWVASNKFEKGPLIEITKLLFVYFWHLWFWRIRFLKIKLYLAVFHFLFGKYSKFRNHVNKF